MATEILIPLIVALLASLPGMLALYAQRRKVAAEADNTISDAALKLLEPYKVEVAELRVKLDNLECDLLKEREKRRELEEIVKKKDIHIADMQVEIDTLREQIEALQKGRRH